MNRQKGVVQVGGRVEVYYRLWKVVLWTLLGVFFVAAGGWLLADLAAGREEGWLLAGLAGLLMVVGAFIAWAFAREIGQTDPLVVLAPEGFAVRGSTLGLVPWADVESVRHVSGEGGAYVVVMLHKDAVALDRLTQRRRWFAALNMRGLPALSIHTGGLGLSAKKLARLFRDYVRAHEQSRARS